VVAALVNDWEAAEKVELDLPETGVCSFNIDENTDGGACCGVDTSKKQTAETTASCQSSLCGVPSQAMVKETTFCCG
jgi:hypothetical protein